MENSQEDLNAKSVHDIWSHWMKHLLENCCTPTGVNGMLQLSNMDVKRWKRLMETDFENLTESEKKSDYEIAEKYLTHLTK